jgi:hypothetical protein
MFGAQAQARVTRTSPAPFLRVAFVLASVAGALPAAAQDFTPVTDPQKTDVLVLRNGDRMTGDFRELSRGIVTFKTDAAAYIYVKWPRVVTAATDKVFDIQMKSGRRYVGSMSPGDAAYRVRILTARDTVEVPIETVVSMVRIKKTFWDRLDGSLDAGFNFTQQNSKVDLNSSIKVHYDVASNRFQLEFDGTFSSQDSVSDIQRRKLTAIYGRALSDRWFWAASAAGASNSQLNLERSWTFGTGPGRFFVLSNKILLGSWLGIYYRNERYTGDDPRSTLPLSLITDLEWFNWSGLSTDLSSRLVVSPILNDAGRWQISFTAQMKHELLSLLYITVGVNEYYDTSPPADANQNDFSVTTSIGWTF